MQATSYGQFVIIVAVYFLNMNFKRENKSTPFTAVVEAVLTMFISGLFQSHYFWVPGFIWVWLEYDEFPDDQPVRNVTLLSSLIWF